MIWNSQAWFHSGTGLYRGMPRHFGGLYLMPLSSLFGILLSAFFILHLRFLCPHHFSLKFNDHLWISLWLNLGYFKDTKAQKSSYESFLYREIFLRVFCSVVLFPALSYGFYLFETLTLRIDSLESKWMQAGSVDWIQRTK